MRTGQMILNLYNTEVFRILQEIEDMLPAANSEVEIFDIQKNLEVHKTHNLTGSWTTKNHTCIHFNCGGSVYYKFQNGSAQIELSKKESLTQEKIDEITQCLNKMHLKELKEIHPKIVPEILRFVVKNWLM
jgi:uncharacterized protein YqfB (UPF0267 family)